MSKKPFARVVAAVATPFLDDDTIDFKRLVAHCRWLLAEGCDGLVLFGTTGESASLTNAERKEIVEALVKDGIDPKQIVVGTGCCAVDETADLSRHALAQGCAGVLVVPPFFFKGLTNDGVARYYDKLIARINDPRLRIYLYHFPQTSGVAINEELVERLKTAHPGVIVGYKDSSGDWSNTEKILARFPDLEVFIGTEVRMTDMLDRGGAGIISATANLHPRAIRAVVDAHGTADAAAAQAKVSATRTAVQAYPLVPATKAVIAAIHKDNTWRRLRAPLSPLPDADADALVQSLNL